MADLKAHLIETGKFQTVCDMIQSINDLHDRDTTPIVLIPSTLRAEQAPLSGDLSVSSIASLRLDQVDDVDDDVHPTGQQAAGRKRKRGAKTNDDDDDEFDL